MSSSSSSKDGRHALPDSCIPGLAFSLSLSLSLSFLSFSAFFLAHSSRTLLKKSFGILTPLMVLSFFSFM